jgi:hypothetical protein
MLDLTQQSVTRLSPWFELLEWGVRPGVNIPSGYYTGKPVPIFRDRFEIRCGLAPSFSRQAVRKLRRVDKKRPGNREYGER